MIEVLQTDEFSKWLRRLKDTNAWARINARIRRLEITGNFGDTKPIGNSISKLRIHYGPRYRVYFTHRGNKIILLLIGGDKTTQQRDIEQAKALSKEY